MPESREPKQGGPRRRWSISEKRRIVELTLCEGASIRTIAVEHGVCPTSLSQWRTQYRAGKLDAQLPQASRARASSALFLPVTIASAVARPRRDPIAGGPSIVQVTLPSGAALRLETDVLDSRVVCALLAQLQR